VFGPHSKGRIFTPAEITLRYLSPDCAPSLYWRHSNPSPQCVFLNVESQLHVSATTRSHQQVKVKWSRYRPGVAQRVGRGIALLFHARGTRRGWVVSSTSWPHFTPPGKTRYPFYKRMGGTQGQSGRAENLVPIGIRSLTVQPVAQSLYRLSYPVPNHHQTVHKRRNKDDFYNSHYNLKSKSFTVYNCIEIKYTRILQLGKVKCINCNIYIEYKPNTGEL